MSKPPEKKKPSPTRTYYINAFICKKSGRPVHMVGLFDSNTWSGITGPGGKVGNEYYLDAKLLAYYRIKPHPFIVNFHNRCGDVKLCGKQYGRIPILSRYKEKHLEADSSESAIEKFSRLQF